MSRSPIATAVLLLVASTALPARAQPFVYVVGPRDQAPPTNRGIQVLTVIDAATNAKVARVELGMSCVCVNPNSITRSRDGGRVFVSNYWANTVSVVDTATNSVVQTLSTRSFPRGVAVSPDGTRLYVATVVTPTPGYVVQVIEIATNATLAMIPLNVSSGGLGLAISPDGSRVYVSNDSLNDNNVAVINTATNTVITKIPAGTTPRGLDITSDGALVYVAAQGSNAVTVISTATNTVTATIGVGVLPTAVAVAPNRSRVYAANSPSVSVIDGQTHLPLGTVSGGISISRAIGFTPDSTRAFVAADAGVFVVDTATSSVIGLVPFTYATEGVANALVVGPASAPPDPPTALAASSIAGNLVTLQWNAPAAGPRPSSYVIEGGITPGEVLGSLPTGGPSPFFTFTAPTGAFYVRVRSLGGGRRSDPSNEIRIFVNIPAPCQAPPAMPVNFVVSVAGRTITASWEAGAGALPSGYVVDVTGSFTGSFATTGRALSGVVPPGAYNLRVAATNACGASPLTPVQVATVQ